MRWSILIACCVLVPTVTFAETTGDDRLRDAFKKEYAFLEAEEAALKRRLAQLKRAEKKENARNQAVLAGLQKQIITRTSEADAMAEKLVEVEREVDALGEGAEALTGLLQQISRALQTNGVEWNPVVKACLGMERRQSKQLKSQPAGSGSCTAHRRV